MRIHFIGICGVAMSALALALHKNGHIVTGSDAGFYPPISTHLQKMGVPYYAGWHPERVLATFSNDPNDCLVVVGNVASSTNPEWLHTEAHKLPHLSYPEAVAKFLLREHSVVVAGTYGKTSSTALLAHIFQKAGKNPSYMFGALAIENEEAAAMTESNWSIVEGDEYKSGRTDPRPKFAHYAPTHLLLTGIQWDHVDLYPTEASYLATFQTLLETIPEDGLIVLNADDTRATALATKTTTKKIFFGTKKSNVDAHYTLTRETIDGLELAIVYKEKTYTVHSPMLGAFQAANIAGCFALATAVGIDAHVVAEAIGTFHGIKRRLEKRLATPVTIFDDIAHSPAKAASVLASLRHLTTGTLTAVFEPNTGNREPSAAPLYRDAFAAADRVIIPRLTKIKIDTTKHAEPLDEKELADVIRETHKNVVEISDDETLVETLCTGVRPGDTIVFLGSHGFRGMIETTVGRLTSLHQ